jgi:hypothetical protein
MTELQNELSLLPGKVSQMIHGLDELKKQFEILGSAREE